MYIINHNFINRLQRWRRAPTLLAPDPPPDSCPIPLAANLPRVRGAADPLRALLLQPARGLEERGGPARGRAPVRPHHQERRREAHQLPDDSKQPGGTHFQHILYGTVRPGCKVTVLSKEN